MASEQLQVLDSIVRAVPIQMVNPLSARQFAPKMLFHDVAMLELLTAVTANSDVASWRDEARRALPRVVFRETIERNQTAFVRTELDVLPVVEKVARHSKGAATLLTSQCHGAKYHLALPSPPLTFFGASRISASEARGRAEMVITDAARVCYEGDLMPLERGGNTLFHVQDHSTRQHEVLL